MKRLIAVFANSTLGLAVLAGCASSQPPKELQDARAAYGQASADPAAQANRAGLMEAQQALDAAERQYAKDSNSDETKAMGYAAQRKAEIAEADGRAAVARAQQQQAEKTYLQMQAAQAQRDAEMNRRAAGVSERRAKVALDRLGLAAKDEPRGTVITLPEASMFATNKAEILPEAKGRLAEIAEAVKQVLAEKAPEDAERRMMLLGHTDDVGSDKHNADLSKRRAQAVLVFFSQHGLNPAMMQAEGRGEAEPVADNKTLQGRAENRRVEIVITPAGSGMGKPAPSKP